MAYIDLGVDENTAPGIQGLLRYRPETARPLMTMAEVLLRGPHTLTSGERELIAVYVSELNDCAFCVGSHSAVAAAQLPGGDEVVAAVLADPETAPISAKLRALLRIAAAVRVDGKSVTPGLVDGARAEGATDREIHDTVLIAALFSMVNRYVDGLGTVAPDAPDAYRHGVDRIVRSGYLGP